MHHRHHPPPCSGLSVCSLTWHPLPRTVRPCLIATRSNETASGSGSGDSLGDIANTTSSWTCSRRACASCGYSCADCSNLALTYIDCDLPLDLQTLYGSLNSELVFDVLVGTTTWPSRSPNTALIAYCAGIDSRRCMPALWIRIACSHTCEWRLRSVIPSRLD